MFYSIDHFSKELANTYKHSSGRTENSSSCTFDSSFIAYLFSLMGISLFFYAWKKEKEIL